MYLLRILDGDRLVAEAPLIIHDYEAAQEVALANGLQAPWAAMIAAALYGAHGAEIASYEQYTALELTRERSALANPPP